MDIVAGLHTWLSPFNQALCTAVLAAVARGENATLLLNAALQGRRNAQGLPLRCVPQTDLPMGMAYEAFIHATGHIPTRCEPHSSGALHDACNALMWVHFPQTKNVLNALQAAAIAADGVRGKRGQLRDALTLFDESALILCCPTGDAAPSQLAQRQWKDLLHSRRGDWHHTLHPVLFGHAVLQKLQQPYPAITAQLWVLEGVFTVDTGSILPNLTHVDTALAASIQARYDAGQLTPKALLPLPVLGIPGWCADNTEPTFYDNRQVFRALASKKLP